MLQGGLWRTDERGLHCGATISTHECSYEYCRAYTHGGPHQARRRNLLSRLLIGLACRNLYCHPTSTQWTSHLLEYASLLQGGVWRTDEWCLYCRASISSHHGPYQHGRSHSHRGSYQGRRRYLLSRLLPCLGLRKMHQHIASTHGTTHLLDHVGLLQGSLWWTNIELLHQSTPQSTHGGSHTYPRTKCYRLLSRLYIGMDGGEMYYHGTGSKWKADLCQ